MLAVNRHVSSNVPERCFTFGILPIGKKETVIALYKCLPVISPPYLQANQYAGQGCSSVSGKKAMIRETVGGTRLSSTSGISTCALFAGELCITVCCTALAVLWMALHKEKFPLPRCRQRLGSQETNDGH